MNKFDLQTEELLNTECYVIDFLPKQVPKSSDGQFFDVEYWFLNKRKDIYKDKFINIILKFMCYYHVSVFRGKWIDCPSPEFIEKEISGIMDNFSGDMNILFPEKNSMLTFSWDSLCLALYNPDEEMKYLAEQISLSEGMFFRKSPN